MVIQNDGTAYGQGIQNQTDQFQFQGRWQFAQGQFVMQGQMSSFFGPQPLFFASNVMSDRQMANTYHAPDGNIIASACQR